MSSINVVLMCENWEHLREEVPSQDSWQDGAGDMDCRWKAQK